MISYGNPRAITKNTRNFTEKLIEELKYSFKYTQLIKVRQEEKYQVNEKCSKKIKREKIDLNRAISTITLTT